MPRAVATKGAKCTGHLCYPPMRTNEGSDFVMAEGVGVLLVGAQYDGHRCDKSWHTGVQSGGSSVIFVEDVPLVRIGDTVSCGSAVATGSNFVFAD